MDIQVPFDGKPGVRGSPEKSMIDPRSTPEGGKYHELGKVSSDVWFFLDRSTFSIGSLYRITPTAPAFSARIT